MYFQFHFIFAYFVANQEKQQASSYNPIINSLQESYSNNSQKQNTIYVWICIVVTVKFLPKVYTIHKPAHHDRQR